MQFNFQSLGQPSQMLSLVCSVFLLQACGEGSATCQPSAAETHVASASVDEHHEAMLHVVGKTCAGVGVNTMRVHFQGKPDSKPGLTIEHDNANADGTIDITLTEVSASMPEMGHGTAAPIQLDDHHANDFSIEFQMPGQWQVTAKFTPKDTTDVETAVFDFEVLD